MKRKPLQLIPSMISILFIAITATAVIGRPETVELLRQIDLDAWHFILAICLFGIPLVAASITYFEYHGIGCQDGIIRRGPNEKVVAITFDDGPNPNYTPQILDILKEKGVKATFFVVGLHVKKYPEIAKRIVDEGHDIGNHTYTHKDLVPATRRMVLAQVNKTDQIIKKVTGVKTNLFRPPRGIYSNAVRKLVVDEKGYRMILWSVSTIDWRKISPNAILRRVARYTRPGAIILFHDSGALVRREGASRENTVQSLPIVIDYLKAKGYEIITVSEMLSRLEAEEMEEAGILSQV